MRANWLEIVENIVTMSMFAVIVIFAPDAWKWAAFFCFLNLNLFGRQEGDE